MKNLMIAAILFAGVTATAQIQFGEMVYGGTGCPAGSLTALQIEGSEGKLLLDVHVESLGSDALVQRKSCSVRLPVSIAHGYQVGLKAQSVKGSLSQPKNVKSEVTSRVGLAGVNSLQALNDVWNSKKRSRFKIEDQEAQYVWSGCDGRDMMIILDASATTLRSDLKQTTSLVINELNFEFSVQRCD